MISRRILRIKVLQTIYSYYQNDDGDLAKYEKELDFSISRSYSLYFFLMQLALDVCDYAQNRIESNRQKHLATKSDLNPNLKFVNNKLIAQLRENKNLQTQIASSKLSWNKHPELIKRLYKDFTESQEYAAYMEADTSTYESDKKIINFFFSQIVCECDLLYQTLEEMSVYWTDSAEFIIGMVIRTIERYRIGYDSDYALMPMYKNEEDSKFARKLLDSAVASCDEYRKLINECTTNWDIERIAFFDILILQTAVAEIEQFPEIPLKVTFNEYIELAKNYSTSRSCTFINGVLDKITQVLRQQKRILKSAGETKGQQEQN
ncbi:MAG: transcription antitermination factor NusB [Bacteroidales bacterium]|nr:transcription antitermination factor NusB [Bacteroidales bacterium]